MDNKRTAQNPAPKRPSRRQRRRRRYLKVLYALIYVALVIGVSVLLASTGWTMANDVLALNKEEAEAIVTLPAAMFDVVEEEVIDEEDGTTEKHIYKILKDGEIDTVAETLHESGMIENKWLFKLFVTISKSEDKFQPGTFTLNTSMDYRALITNMGSSSETRATVKVTFPEGSTVDQIFALMEEKGVSTVEQLESMAASHDYAFSFLQDIPLGDHHRLEGFLFPDTYEFYLDEDPKYAINKLLVNFDLKFTDEMREEAKDAGYSVREILIIASMVEKETDGTDEKNISSVIYNRLKNNGETAGFLQIDATIAYVNGGEVSGDDTQTVDSPYNTYKYKGLPPGPIANPGMAAIKAAMEPNKTNYYFYVLNPNTNRHEYTTRYGDHQNLVNKYYG